MKIEVSSVPPQKMLAICDFFRSYGVSVHFNAESGIGEFESVAGYGWFSHYKGTLLVFIEQNRGHFPERMIRGGLRQAVEEIVDRVVE